ncbi:MAG: hypothetical protein AAF889_14940 [Cyanobacteria bacterium P01_D01_bin.73]
MPMPTIRESQGSAEIGWGFQLQWILVTLVGFLTSLYWIEVGGTPDLNAVEGVIGGGAIAIAQWFVIRQKFPRAGWWIPVSVFGWGVLGLSHIGAIGWIVPSTSSIYLRILYGVLNGAQVGLLMGVAQWLVLRRSVPMSVPKAERWILASVAGWTVGLSLGWTMGEVLHRITGIFLGEVVGLTLAWVVVAAVTGPTLIRLAGRRIPEDG